MLAKQFMFEGREERLRHRVVERATDAPHRLADPKRPARGPERVGGVLGGFKWSSQHLECGGVVDDDARTSAGGAALSGAGSVAGSADGGLGAGAGAVLGCEREW